MAGAFKVGLIGYGVAGRVFHAPFIAANPELELAAVVTSQRDRLRSEHPGATALADVDALLARDDLDLVVVASPTPLHVEHARAALDAGIATVVDKPFAPSVSGGRELIERAERAGVPFTVFQNRRWDGDFLTLSRLIASGELGDVHRFESRFEWWMPTADKSWKSSSDAADGGGIVYDLGAHLIDQALQLFGPATVAAADVHTRRQNVSAADDAFVLLHHKSGVESHLWMSAVAPIAGPRFHVLGSKAGFETHGLDPQEDQLAAGMTPENPALGRYLAQAIVGAGPDADRREIDPGRYADFYRGVADALRSGTPMPVDPYDSLAALEIIESIYNRK